MKNVSYHIVLFLTVLTTLPFLPADAQPALHTTVSTRKILIGEPVSVQWEASLPSEGFIQWPVLPDSIPHFEWLEKSAIDTVFAEKGITALRQYFRITSFDSGDWKFPALQFSFKPVDSDSAWQLMTDSFLLQVRYQLDTVHTIRDIKPIRLVAEPLPLWPWLAGLATIVLMAAWYWLFRKPTPSLNATTADPAKAARGAIEALRKWPLEDAAAVLQFHYQLSAIFREYLSRRAGIPAYSKTSGDLLIALARYSLSPESISSVADVLRCCDAVKFARYQPDTTGCFQHLDVIGNLITSIESYHQPSVSS